MVGAVGVATGQGAAYVFAAPASVTGLSPASGPAAGGTRVTISGTNLSGITAVDFGSTPADLSSLTYNSDGTVTVTSPAGSGTVDVTVTNASGTSASLPADQFTYTAAPAVTAISPTAGPVAGSTQVTITGTNLSGITAVDFGKLLATIVAGSDTATLVTVISPASQAAGIVDVTVTTVGGASTGVPADQFTYTAAPAVTAISPTAGPVAGGTQVTITGTNLSGITAVDFGKVLATIVAGSDTATLVTVISPASQAAGIVDVTVTTAGGASTGVPADQFTYVAAPAVTAISPTAGPLASGTQVTISGTNLLGITAVDFGKVPATIVAGSDTATSITVISPTSQAAGIVDVTVTTAGGTSTGSPADQFTYTAAPTVTAVSPTAGPLAGGTQVTISGANLSGITAVDFGKVLATVVAGSDTATSVTVISPASQAAGIVDVTVTTAGGTSTGVPADQFTYVAAPAVTAISPTAGPVAGGTQVTITGTNLSGITAVDFGKVLATIVAGSDTATSIAVISPASQAAGIVDVTVTTAGGTSATSAADQFTYTTAPIVSTVTPQAGPLSGGMSVTITGTNLTGAKAVRFGKVAAKFTVKSATQIVATSPAGKAGMVDVTVVAAAGTSGTSALDQFTFVAAPAVTKISAAAGPTAGGTQVTISGANLAGATAVRFGKVAAAFSSSPTGQIVATSPAGTAGIVNVTVVTAGGASKVSAADKFTYVALPAVAKLAPAAGPLAGGTTVTITGTNLAGGTVLFGTQPATKLTSVKSTQIVAISPPGLAGPVTVVVTTAGGRSQALAADQFAYTAAPTVDGLTPASGGPYGGSIVTIRGANLAGDTAIHFGAGLAKIQSMSDTQIIVTSPPGKAGTVDVTVTTPGGTSVTSAADKFTYAVATKAPAIVSSGPATFHVNDLALLALAGQSSPSGTIQRNAADYLTASLLARLCRDW